MGFYPIVSIINTLCTLYFKNKNYNYNYNKENYIFSLFIILILTSSIEYINGHLFILALILIFNCINYDTKEKKLESSNVYFTNGTTISFFSAVALVGIILLSNNIFTRLLIIFFITSIYFIFQYIKDNTNHNNKYDLIEEYQHYYLLGTSITTIILLWAEYEKKPNIKYIKLFCRK
jgi:hypothetical protein